MRIGDFIFLPPIKNDSETDLSISLLTPDEYLRRGGVLFEKRYALEKEYYRNHRLTRDLREQLHRTLEAMNEL